MKYITAVILTILVLLVAYIKFCTVDNTIVKFTKSNFYYQYFYEHVIWYVDTKFGAWLIRTHARKLLL